MRKNAGWMLIVGLVLGGCAVEAAEHGQADEVTDEAVNEAANEAVNEAVNEAKGVLSGSPSSQASLAAPSADLVAAQVCFVECYYAFYWDAAKTQLAGECESGLGVWPRGCWGTQTQHRTGGCWRTCEPREDLR